MSDTTIDDLQKVIVDELKSNQSKGNYRVEMSKETLESVFAGLPNGCSLTNPNSYTSTFKAAYKEHSRKNAVVVYSGSPSGAVIKLANKLSELGIANPNRSVKERE